MIVTCEACLTSFNLNDERVRPSGSKVRCSKCQNIFKVYPPIAAEPTPALPTETADINRKISSTPPLFEFSQLNEHKAQQTPLSDHSAETLSFPKSYSDITEYDFSEIDKMIQADKREKSEPGKSENDLLVFPEDELADMDLALDAITATSESKPQEAPLDDFEKSLEMDFSDISLMSPADDETAYNQQMNVTAAANGKSQKFKHDQFSEDEPGGFNDIEALDLSDIESLLDEQAAGEFTTSLAGGAETFKRSGSLIVSAPSDTETDTTLEMEKQYLTFDELQLNKDESASATLHEVKESFSPDIDVFEPPSEPSLQKESKIKKTGSGDEDKPPSTDTVIEEEPEETPPAPKKGISPLLIVLLILAVIAGLIYGGYTLIDSNGISIPFTKIRYNFSFLSKESSSKIQDPGNFKIKPFDISSRFIDNTKIGKLFVITGKAKNEYPTARGAIQVIGKLYTKDKAMAKAETVFCGNIISDMDLANAEQPTIQKRLQNPSGDNDTNLKVAPNDAVPFMLVFSNLPDNLDEFTLEVTASVAK